MRERWLAYDELLEGPDEGEVVRARICAVRPRRLLDVGSGFGELCAWATADLDAEVVSVDSSPRMVELSAQAGATAILADMRELPFPDGSFDCVVAARGALPRARSGAGDRRAGARPRRHGVFLATTGSDEEHERRLAWAVALRRGDTRAVRRSRSAARTDTTSSVATSTTSSRSTATSCWSSRRANGSSAMCARSYWAGTPPSASPSSPSHSASPTNRRSSRQANPDRQRWCGEVSPPPPARQARRVLFAARSSTTATVPLQP